MHQLNTFSILVIAEEMHKCINNIWWTPILVYLFHIQNHLLKIYFLDKQFWEINFECLFVLIKNDALKHTTDKH